MVCRSSEKGFKNHKYRADQERGTGEWFCPGLKKRSRIIITTKWEPNKPINVDDSTLQGACPCEDIVYFLYIMFYLFSDLQNIFKVRNTHRHQWTFGKQLHITVLSGFSFFFNPEI